jgi:hypothetical protein
MKRLFASLKSLNREAALDSAKNVLMAIGVGTVLGDLATAKLFFGCFSLFAVLLVWYVDYWRHF